MKRQYGRFGFSYDWSTEISSCEPEYYRWNQWFFIKMYERGLAYRKKAQVNWCPECATVLANEQVVDGCCWRHEQTPVIKRNLEQWFLRITDYADQLLDDHDQLQGGWPERVLTMQKNWIGRSTGTRADFTVDGSGEKITVFTTRVDTIFGATCVILAPEHPLVEQFGLQVEAQKLIQTRTTDPAVMNKEGVATGRFAINPYNGEKVPIWLGNFVLSRLGSALGTVGHARTFRAMDARRRKMGWPRKDATMPERSARGRRTGQARPIFRRYLTATRRTARVAKNVHRKHSQAGWHANC
jgi:leucyl-tRNA synthetase